MRLESDKRAAATFARAFAIIATSAALAPAAPAAQARPSGLGPEMRRLLKASTDFLAAKG